MFDTEKSGNKTSSGEIATFFNIVQKNSSKLAAIRCANEDNKNWIKEMVNSSRQKGIASRLA